MIKRDFVLVAVVKGLAGAVMSVVYALSADSPGQVVLGMAGFLVGAGVVVDELLTRRSLRRLVAAVWRRGRSLPAVENCLVDRYWDTSLIPRERLATLLRAAVEPLLNERAVAFVDLVSDTEDLPPDVANALANLEGVGRAEGDRPGRGSDRVRMGVPVDLREPGQSAAFFTFAPYSIHTEMYPNGEPTSGRDMKAQLVVHDCGEVLSVRVPEQLWPEVRTLLDDFGLGSGTEARAE